MEMGRRSSRVVRTSALLLGDKIGNNVGGWPPFGFFLPIFEPWVPRPFDSEGAGGDAASTILFHAARPAS